MSSRVTGWLPYKQGRKLLSMLTLTATLMVAFTGVSAADPFRASATIYLQSGDGTEKAIGTLTIAQPDEQQSGIKVDIDNSSFTEHFLSMRPFRCIESQAEWFCYLEYPYDLKNVISVDDLSDLEYQLLFLKKKPSEFGIDAWNGLYYKLALNANGEIHGELLEGDLNVLQSPPPNKYDKPVDLNEFIEASKDKRLYPTLVIR